MLRCKQLRGMGAGEKTCDRTLFTSSYKCGIKKEAHPEIVELRREITEQVSCSTPLYIDPQ